MINYQPCKTNEKVPTVNFSRFGISNFDPSSSMIGLTGKSFLFNSATALKLGALKLKAPLCWTAYQ